MGKSVIFGQKSAKVLVLGSEKRDSGTGVFL